MTDGPADDDKPVIGLRLADLHVEPTSNRLAPSIVLRLDYVITVAAADILLVHRYLGEIAFALAERPVLDIADGVTVMLRVERSEAGLLGIAVSAALPRERMRVAAPPVLRAPEVQVGEMGRIEGMVQGPDGGAIAGVLVEIAALKLRQVTAADGRFRFDTPAGASNSFKLAARKHRFSQTVDVESGQHLTLQLSLEN